MKTLLTMAAASLAALGILAGCAQQAGLPSGSVTFDFEADDAGFTPSYADYPNSEGVEEFYEFRHAYGEIPIDRAGKGIFISGNNHSDDLFMGYVKRLEGLAPGQSYRFTLSFRLATDVEGSLVGVGGAPGEGVTVKCGVTSTQPVSAPDGDGPFAHYRLNIDAGLQGNGGKDMVVVGDMAKPENNRPGEYEFKQFQAQVTAAANAQGKVFLIIGTDSGFEATTSYYLDDIQVAWEGAEQPPAGGSAQPAA